MNRTWCLWAGILGATGVAIGAFGAHGLPHFLERSGVSGEPLARRVESFEIGVRYHLWHAVALIGLAALSAYPSRALSSAGWLWIGGIVVFSGCLYGYALTGERMLARIVPLGGISYIAGWIALAVAAVSRRA
jgi:uncharacterized membrane protein YgdD (TMEM256/DUF423 family)